MSPNSVNLTISVIQNSMRTANTLGLVPTYELHKIKRPKVKEKKVECFTKAEQKQIETAVLADNRPKMIGVLLCLYTGLRLGEVMALEWSDIDFQKGELSVMKACHDTTKPGGGFERITGTPKTDSSVRTIPVPRQILPYLKEAKKQNGSKFVVGDGDKVLSLRSYQLSFEGLLKRLKIPHRGFHSLRHTFATRALECGMDVRTLADILGHDNPMITLKRYAHSMEEHKKEMMNRVGKLARCGNCQFCYKGKCSLKECCCMGERVKAGSCSFTELLNHCFRNIGDNVFRFRLRIAAERATEEHSCFLSKEHFKRFREGCALTHRNDNGFIAQLFLLSADETLWKQVSDLLFDGKFSYGEVSRFGLTDNAVYDELALRLVLCNREVFAFAGDFNIEQIALVVFARDGSVNGIVSFAVILLFRIQYAIIISINQYVRETQMKTERLEIRLIHENDWRSMLDLATGKTVTLGEITPEWWIP